MPVTDGIILFGGPIIIIFVIGTITYLVEEEIQYRRAERMRARLGKNL